MGVWNKSPQVDPSIIARLQAELDANPTVRQYRGGGYGTGSDLWQREGGGRVKNPNQLSEYARSLLGQRLPDGYDVSQDGKIVYTNKTPFLQQATLASLPITGPLAAEWLLGLGGAAGGAGGAGGAANLSGFGGATTGTGAAAALGQGGAALPAALGTAAPGAGSRAGNAVLDWLKHNPDKVIGGVGALVSGLKDQPTTMDDPNVRALLEMAVKRQTRTDPLHEMTTRLAESMMPRMVQRPREGQ